MMKRGFTIIEMMAVIGIIAILLGIVMSVSGNSMRLARQQKAGAIVACVQQGIETYHAQKDRWPGPVGEKAEHGVSANDFDNRDIYELSAPDVRSTIFEVVRETVGGNPLMDISGLFVSRDSGEDKSTAYGMDFWVAVHGDRKKSPRKMSISEMYFGYPESSSGHFRRLRISYSIPTDSMEVKQ